WTTHSPTGSGPEGSSPNEHGSGRSSASHLDRNGVIPEPDAALCAVSAMTRCATKEGMNDAPKPALEQTGLDLGGGDQPSYRVLARKYRPSNFDDLIGQEAMVRTVSNAFETGRIPQAWILSGVRGVGKTTTARILARALNYELPDGSVKGPTIQMPVLGLHCQAIMESRHMDVLEMDAASHTGVDDVRQINDSVRYAPASARYKVYIIDEVHMLST